jgi:CRISPR-associated endonuclease/helicase Cas3
MNDETQDYYKYWGKASSSEDDDLSFHLLPYHCLDVAAVGMELLRNDERLRRMLTDMTGVEEGIIENWLMLCLALHDMGKFSEGFQNLRSDLFLKLQGRKSDKTYSVRHDSLGYLIWKKRLWDVVWTEEFPGLDFPESEKRSWERTFDCFAQAVTGHHGKPPEKVGANGLTLPFNRYFGTVESTASEEFVRDVVKLFRKEGMTQFSLSSKELRGNIQRASWMLAGIAVLCDWIASRYYPFCMEPMSLEKYWREHASLKAKASIEKSGIFPAKANDATSFSSLFPDIENPTPLQKQAAGCHIKSGPQLFILEDMTGTGKTEAALILASRLMNEGRGSGIYVALPTMATANAMYDRLATAYRKLFTDKSSPSLVLAHSARHLSGAFRKSILAQDAATDSSYDKGDDSATALCSSWIADNRKKSLLADVGVGTLDQALLSVLPSRHQSLRLLGLSRHILIVDEVHAYDSYTLTLLRNLLRFHSAMGGSAILLSATLPIGVRQDLIDSFSEGMGITPASLDKRDAYPLFTHLSSNETIEALVEAQASARGSLNINFIYNSKEVEDIVVDSASSGQCVCWIRNTVDDATDAYEALKKRIDHSRLILFHARFAMGDRLSIEGKVLKNFGKTSGSNARKGKILIATQVVEQSLDLDFDVMITDLAPMDLIIQRAGRLHRHRRDIHGNLLIDGDMPDQRGVPCLNIFSPRLDIEIRSDWYKTVFPKAAWVYPSHGRLWLTATLLDKNRGWTMPEDARNLMESVFSDEHETEIPEALQESDMESNVQDMVNKALAKINVLKLEDGYSVTPNQWLDDTQARTRLGEITTTVRLARWDGKVLKSWHERGDFPWNLSQVNINAKRVYSEMEYKDADAILANAVQSLKSNLADRGKWTVLVPLTSNEDGCWQGYAKDMQDERVTLLYSPDTGLRFYRKGK